MKKNLFAFVSPDRLFSSLRFAVLLLAVLLLPLVAHAFSLPWTCGFEGGNLGSCNLSSLNGNNTDYTSTAAAHTGNYGYRITDDAGWNVGTGGFYGALDNATSDFYVRWYMRASTSLQMGQYMKLITLFTGGTETIYNITNSSFFLEPGPGGNFNTGSGWDSIMGSANGDGQWHCYELHATVSGTQEWWVDGVSVGSTTGASLGISSWSGSVIEFGTNQDIPAGGTVDWDDIAMATTGPIGPLPGGKTPAVSTETPNAPTLK